ncbi:hypothetical protein BST61_g1370 [Cercospora zeina]
MAHPSRDEYMSNLGHEDCAICYQPMAQPTRTPCRHYYCLECLQKWLKTNNTCPSCRTILFEKPAEPNAGAQHRDVSAGPSREESFEDYLHRLDGVRPTVPRIASIRPQMIAFESTAMSLLLAVLQSPHYIRAEGDEDLGDCDVQYRFTLDDDDHLWTFDGINYAIRSAATASALDDPMRTYEENRRREWTRSMTIFLDSVDARELDRRVEFLRRADIGRLPQARRLVVSVLY